MQKWLPVAVATFLFFSCGDESGDDVVVDEVDTDAGGIDTAADTDDDADTDTDTDVDSAEDTDAGSDDDDDTETEIDTSGS
jgi:hypothetical protein